MQDALAPRAPHPYRRAGVIVRLVLYPMALGLIALAWHEYHGSDTRKGHVYDVVRWSGVTSQGQAIRARTSDGVLTGLLTRVEERCRNGRTFHFGWAPGQYRFAQHGESVRGRQAGPGRTTAGDPFTAKTTLWAQLGDRPHGGISAHLTWSNGGQKVPCASDEVTFSLRRLP
jgi:hypothetical protein